MCHLYNCVLYELNYGISRVDLNPVPRYINRVVLKSSFVYVLHDKIRFVRHSKYNVNIVKPGQDYDNEKHKSHREST